MWWSYLPWGSNQAVLFPLGERSLMGAALLCVESSAATVGQQIHTHNTTDNYDLHHISRSHTTFQVSTLNCMIPNDIYRSHTTYQGSSLRLVIPHHVSGSHTTYQISSLRFMIPHNVSGSRPAFQVSTLQFVIPHQVPHQGYNLPFVIPHFFEF